MGLKDVAGRLRPRLGQSDDLVRRVEALEADVLELRRHNVRLAEIADVVQELLVPLASRDQARIDEAIEKFSKSL
jgi:transposase-like protein